MEGARGRMRAGEGRRDAEEEITSAGKVGAHGRNGAVRRGSWGAGRASARRREERKS